MSYSIHKLPKLEKFLLLTSIFSGLTALLIATAAFTTSPQSLTSEAQTLTQVVRSWNFTYSKENWKSFPVWNSTVTGGVWNVKIGPATARSLILNRQALAKLIYPVKYVTLKFAVLKNTSPAIPTIIIPPPPATASADAITTADRQILNLPYELPPPAATSTGQICTADVMTCPDGSFVPRVPPACQFAPCPQVPYSTFTFNLYYKKLDSSFWRGPVPLTGRASPYFQEFFIKIPEPGILTLEALKIEFSKGVSAGDIVKIDSIQIKQEKPLLITPTWYTPSVFPTRPTVPTCMPKPTPCPIGQPCSYQPPPPGSWYCPDKTPTLPYRPTPTPVTCITPPPCYYGIKDPAGYTLYCMPPYPGYWCPVRPTPTCVPRPECLDAPIPCQLVMPPGGFNFCPVKSPTPAPSCVPYPPNCITWQNGKAVVICQFFRAENWCPLPTCIPRPACLDSVPKCLIPETPDMCPPTYPVPTYNP